MVQSITLQTSDSDIISGDILGRLSFAASSETSGSDALLIGGGIYAEAEDTFTQIANATSLVFSTASSETAIGKLKITSSGYFLPLLNNAYDIGSSSFVFRNLYVNSGIFTNLSVSGASVSLVGHTHTSSNITDFNSSVSGILPVKNIVAGSGITISSSDATYTINSTATGGTPSPTGNFVVESLHVSNRYTETVSAISISSNILVINLDTCNLFSCDLNSNINTLTISNVPSASGIAIGFSIIFIADGTARSVSWPSSIKWQAGTAPNITSVNGKIDTFSFLSINNGTSWLGFVGGQNY